MAEMGSWHPLVLARALLSRASGAERLTLLVLGGVAALVLAFAMIAEEVMEGETRGLDRKLLLMLRNPENLADPLGPRWLEEMMRDFTALGGIGVVALLVVGVSGFLALTGRRRTALLVLGSIAGGLLLSTLLKAGFSRPRPDLVRHGSIVYTSSFPSGHSTMSAVVYLTLGALLARTQASTLVKLYIMGAAAFLTLLVGVSRIYLGVHWPTDVLAGWVLGSAWAVLCWLAMLWMQDHGQVEPEAASLSRPEAASVAAIGPADNTGST